MGIASIAPGTFDKIPLMFFLDMSNNKLASLPAGVFDKLFTLNELYLSGNQLTSLPTRVFKGMLNMWYLDLSNNKLACLPPEIFDDFKSPYTSQGPEIDISGNSFACYHRSWTFNILRVDSKLPACSSAVLQDCTTGTSSYQPEQGPTIVTATTAVAARSCRAPMRTDVVIAVVLGRLTARFLP
eukprot:758412-Hanusia_phi.AAC.7